MELKESITYMRRDDVFDDVYVGVVVEKFLMIKLYLGNNLLISIVDIVFKVWIVVKNVVFF